MIPPIDSIMALGLGLGPRGRREREGEGGRRVGIPSEAMLSVSWYLITGMDV